MSFYSDNRAIIREINRDYRIRLNFYKSKRTIKGAGRLDKYLREELVLRLFNEVLDKKLKKRIYSESKRIRLEIVYKEV